MVSIETLLIKFKHYFSKLHTYESMSTFWILVGLILIFTVFSPCHAFLKYENIEVILTTLPTLGLITMGMALLMIAGEFDLSVGSIYAFSCVFLAILFTNYGVCVAVAIPLTFALGAVMGILNGVIVVKLHVNSLIATLGMMWIYRGILYIWTSARSVVYHTEGIYRDIFVGKIGYIPVQLLWIIIAVVVLWVISRHTRLGSRVYATGSNKYSAQMMGINTDRIKIICFAITGFLCALAGVIAVSRIYVGIPSTGQMLNLQVIAGAVVGGIALFGGTGSIFGALIGATIIQILNSGLVMLGATTYYFNIALGLILIVGLIISLKIKRRTA